MINKINVRIKVNGGFRYFSLRYLKHIAEKGSCHTNSPSSFINTIWFYKNEYIPYMEAQGWKRETINISDSVIPDNLVVEEL